MRRTPAPIKLEALRCEYLEEPLAIEDTHPRLSWRCESRIRGVTPTACQILVASAPELVDEAAADRWDSGQIAWNAGAHVEYRGRKLRARQECHWKVRVWDAAGHVSAWSQPAHWEMGLLTEADWRRSQWIGIDGPALSPDGLPAPYLRREFNVTVPIRRARVYASGLGYADIYLNGRRLGGTSERSPGYTRFDRRVLYVAEDVTSGLRTGRNAIGAVLGTGWYDVHDLAVWEFDRAPWRGRPRLRFVLAMEGEDGRTRFVVSDVSWRAAQGSIRRDGIYTGEVYDARIEMPGWSEPGFDDRCWAAVDNLPSPGGRLTALRCPPIRASEIILSGNAKRLERGGYLIDFGRNMAGHAVLTTNAPAATRITLRYGEKLTSSGRLDQSNIDHFMTKTEPPQPFQQDSYVAGLTRAENWEPRFAYHGFQYVEVAGLPGKLLRRSVRARRAHTHAAPSALFSCSDTILNRIFDATLAAYQSNAQSVPTDCPTREKNGWTGDAHLAAETGLMCFQSAAFYTKWLDDIADAQRPDGGIPVVVPTGGWGDGATWPGPLNPPWDSAYHLVAWYLYRYTGDLRVLKRHYDGMRRYVDFAAAQAVDGIMPAAGLGDWLAWSAETATDLISTAYLYADARIVADAAALVGKRGASSRYGALAESVKTAFHARFFDPAAHAYGSGSQTAQAIALFFGLVPEFERQAVIDALIRSVEQLGHIDTGVLGAKYLLRVLSQNGRTDLAYRLVARTEQPGWGWWIAQGATTLWEDWKGEGSRNHVMFGDVANWMLQHIAGVALDAQSPAFRHVAIRPPVVGGLTKAIGTFAVPAGWISVDWLRQDGDFHLNVVVPAGVAATVYLPARPDADIREGGLPAATARGVHLISRDTDCAVYSIASGYYAFVSRLD